MTDIEKPGESSRTISGGTIPLYLINGVGTVWDAQTAATLHCVHNISGIRAGTLPGVAQQNTFLGLPLTLMQEETAYLVSQGIAHLVPLPTYPVFPSAATVEEHTRARVERLRLVEAANREIERVKHEKAREGFVKGGDKAKAKREARAQRKAEEAAAKAAAEQDGELEGIGGPSGSQQSPKGDESTTAESSRSGAGHELSAAAEGKLPPDQPERPAEPDSTDAVVRPADDTLQPITGLHFHSVPALHVVPQPDIEPITSLPHPLFPFPSTPRDHALLATFTDLLARALRVGLGPRFGGEYLVYPGDYLRYHAHFTSQVLVRDEPIRPTELVAWGRLGTGTKKAGLICAWDDGKSGDEPVAEGDEGRVEYYSLEWANFG